MPSSDNLRGLLAASSSVGGKLYGKLRQERARAEAAEAALRQAEEWIQEVDHVEDCAAFDRTSSRECDCGRTAILKRVRGSVPSVR